MKLLLLLAAALPVLAQCPYTFSPPASQNIAIAADSSASPNAIAISAPAGCSWLYKTDSSWIAFPGVTNPYGTGNGAISWVAAANLGPGARVGHISLTLDFAQSTVFTVVQAAPNCTLMLNPTSASAVVAGGTGAFQVETNCVWVSGSQASFLTLTSASTGSLNGTLSYTVAQNPCVPNGPAPSPYRQAEFWGPCRRFRSPNPARRRTSP